MSVQRIVCYSQASFLLSSKSLLTGRNLTDLLSIVATSRFLYLRAVPKFTFLHLISRQTQRYSVQRTITAPTSTV